MHPTLGGTLEWSIILPVFGGVTLLWGAANALKQTDLKQMLAQTTVGSLGLLVLLLGIGTEAAISAAVVYLVAHSFFKGGLFLVAGSIDHGTGTRELTELGGLRRAMPFTFAAAALGALSMCGLPPALGFLAKEEMYGAMLFDWSYLSTHPENIAVLLVLMAGNAMMFAVAAAIAIRPFLGPQIRTPRHAHEGTFGLWGGALLLGLLAIAAVIWADWAGHEFLVPTASAIYNFEVESQLHFNWMIWEWFLDFPLFYLSLITWAAGVAIFWQLDRIRTLLRRFREWLSWDFDIGFDWAMFSLVRVSDTFTRIWHHGRLELYLTVVFVMLAAALYLPLWLTGGLPAMPEFPDLQFYEWAVMAIAVIGLLVVLSASTRLVAIVSLGIQGFGVALLFMLFGAPDLSFTQFMVEILTVVILALVMTRLHLDQHDNRVLENMLRDGALALACGAGITILMLAVLQTPLDLRLTEFFAETSVPIAHGHNIVNVILVDYRGLDTLGEISVVMTAGIAILALIRIRGGGPQTGIGAVPKTPTRRRPRNGVAA
jgi:multicomponent Na+:H+ antiporter subunit A